MCDVPTTYVAENKETVLNIYLHLNPVSYPLSLPRLNISVISIIVCLFLFVALRPMSTAMVIAGRSVHLTTLFPGQA